MDLWWLQVAKDWGWKLIDSTEYVRIADLYGCEYGFKQGRGQSDGIFGLLQPPAPDPQQNSAALDFSGEYVRVVTGVVVPQ